MKMKKNLKSRRRSALGTAVVAALLVAGCGSARPNKYYTLDLPGGDAGGAATRAQFDVNLLVGRLNAPHIYREDRIVYRTGGAETGTYEYHRWAEPPTEMLEAMLVRKLRAGGKFSSVQTHSSNTHGDYILRGRLHEFAEVSSGGGMGARVTLEMELYDSKSGATVWTQFYNQDEPVAGKEVPDVVSAMNRNVQRAVDQVTAGLEQYFAAKPKK